MALFFFQFPVYFALKYTIECDYVMKFQHGNQPDVLDVTDQMVYGNRFYTTPDGEKYPSITTILGSGPKPWLEAWTKSLGKDKAAAEKQRCADRGSALHDMVEKYLQNVENPTDGHDRANIGLFNQIKLQLSKRVGEIRAQEIPLFSDTLRVAGRVDCVAEYDGVLSIIDFKTSNNNKTDDMIEDYFLQCTAYALMYYEMYGVLIEDIVVVIAVERGMMPLVFKRKIHDYIKPLQKRVNDYYSRKAK